MSFAEIVLRIGASIGGWLIFLAHALTVAVVRRADCDPFSDQLWRGTLLLALLSGLALCFVAQGLPWRGALRWLALAASALAFYAALQIAPALVGSTSEGVPLCSVLGAVGGTATGAPAHALPIERVWAPAQLAVLAAGIGQGIRYWRRPDAGPPGR